MGRGYPACQCYSYCGALGESCDGHMTSSHYIVWSTTIWVGRIKGTVQGDELQRMLEKFGRVLHVEVRPHNRKLCVCPQCLLHGITSGIPASHNSPPILQEDLKEVNNDV